MDTQLRRPVGANVLFVLFGIMLVCGVWLLMGSLTGGISVTAIRVTKLGVHVRHHADVDHPEAEEIRKCLDNNGPFAVWRAFSKDRYFFICQFAPGRWGVQIVGKDGMEASAYQPFKLGVKNGTLPQDGVSTFGELKNWLDIYGNRFTGPIPWLK